MSTGNLHLDARCHRYAGVKKLTKLDEGVSPRRHIVSYALSGTVVYVQDYRQAN